MRKIVLLIIALLVVNCIDAQTELWGMTQTGGQYGAGSIYKTDANGNNKIIEYSFFQKEGHGISSSNLIEASDGKFYGMTTGGGLSNLSGGVIFQYDAVTNVYVKKYDFLLNSNGSYGVNGGNPKGSLIQAANGKIYGLTNDGGVNNLGVMFQFDPLTDVYTKLLDFNGSVNGANPDGSLYQANDGNLYGVTLSGGSANSGVLFQYNPISNTFTKKLDFNNGTIAGISPQGSLIQAADGKLYGMTDGNVGSIFQYDISTNNYVVKFIFDGIVGDNPNGALLEATDGKLYGVTQGNGVGTVGTIFQFDPTTNICVNKYTFSSVAPTINGYSPHGSLIQATDGNLYGMTKDGGTSGYSGVTFQFNPITNVYTKKNDHGSIGTFMQASDGKLYAMNTNQLFKYDITSNTYSIKFTFNEGLQGKEPRGSLIKASDGKLYGLTGRGGTNDNGVLFQYDPVTHTYLVKYDFPGVITGGLNGGNSSSSLFQASDGNLYGMNSNGGANNGGVIFQYNIASSVFTKKIDFGPTSGVSGPRGNLIQATNGKLYGLSYYGGTNGKGTLFQYDYTTNSLTKKVDFTGTTNGSYPAGSLLQASDGMLYGMTYSGGTSNYGVLFQYNPTTNSLIKKVDFSGSGNGANPLGNLIEATNGKLYGVTNNGGSFGAGVLFNFDPLTNIYTNENNIGLGGVSHPRASITQATNGKFYGVYAPNLNNNSDGLYQYDLSSSTLLSRFTFSVVNGAITNGASENSNLLEIASSFSTAAINTSSVNANHCYGNSVNINIPYTVIGTFNAGNVFTAQLSDAYGSFATALSIGSITAISSGSINSMIPSSSSSGNTYRIRVISSNPALVGNDYGNIIIYPNPIVTVNSGSVCAGNSYTIVPSGANTYTISGGSSIVTPTANSSYTVSGIDINGCVNSTNVYVNVSALPLISISSSASVVCVGSSISLMANGASQYTWSDGSTSAGISLIANSSVNYSVTGTDLNGCVNTQTISITVDNTCADVWPGDANSDGTADNLDVLELGLHYTQTGAQRASVSNTWQSYFANNWIGTITNGKNLNHSDCNGDGIIDANDTLAIFNNYGLTHAFKPAQTNTVNPQLSIVPDQPMVVKGMWGTASVYLGDATNAIANINGVAFTVDFDNTLIEPNSIWIEYQNSFMDAGQNLHFRKLDFVNSKLFTASTHTVSNNVSGFGKIATLHYQILSSLATDQVLNIGLSQANQSNASGVISPLTSGTGTLMAIRASVGVQENSFGSNVLISPNPTNGLLNINFSTIPQNTKIEMYNSIGAMVLTEIMSNKYNAINISDLSNGIYFMKVLEGNKAVSVKKVVKE